MSDKPSAFAKPVVFCIGLPGTGNGSLQEALSRLGWNVCDDTERMEREIVKWFRSGIGRPFGSLLKDFNAFFHSPVLRHYRELSKAHPDARFIMLERDISECLAYRLLKAAWCRLHPEREKWPVSLSNVNTYEAEKIDTMLRQEVRSYFDNCGRPLLLMDVTRGDGWDKLCNFLGVERPSLSEPFPHVSSTQQAAKRLLADIASGFADYWQNKRREQEDVL